MRYDIVPSDLEGYEAKTLLAQERDFRRINLEIKYENGQWGPLRYLVYYRKPDARSMKVVLNTVVWDEAVEAYNNLKK